MVRFVRVRRALVFGGLVLLGLAEAWWAKTSFPASVAYATLLLAGGAALWWEAARRSGAGFAAATLTHALIFLGWIIEGNSGVALLIVAALAAGFGVATWATLRDRPHTVAAGLLAAGLLQSIWTVQNANLAFEGFFPGNLLFTIGAVLAAAGLWRSPGARATMSA